MSKHRHWLYLAAAISLTPVFVQMAYNHRGYMAVGSEYLVVPVLIVLIEMVLEKEKEK